VVKPFAFAELAARVRSHLRTVDRASAASRSDEVIVGDLHLDLRRREVLKDDEGIQLSAREFALLEYLMRHPGQVLSRQQILDGVAIALVVGATAWRLLGGAPPKSSRREAPAA
jgi:DNA-binding response OmpR family regulator